MAQPHLFISQTINDLYECDQPISTDLASHYLQVTINDGTESDVGAGLRIFADSLCKEGRFSQAIEIIENTLRGLPQDLILQHFFQNWLPSIVPLIETLGKTQNENPEFGRAYFKLQDLGLCTVQMHHLAIQHFFCLGNQELAQDLANRLSKAYPALPGLSKTLSTLNTPKKGTPS
jgi:hypothetical protein